METTIAAVAAAILVSAYLVVRLTATVTVYQFQRGLKYRNGTYVSLLSAGKYRYLKARTSIQIVDMRKMMVTLPGQEVLTKDNINVKITLVGFYELTDPVRSVHGSQNYLTELYSIAQLVVRDRVGAVTLDELLEKKRELDALLLAGVAERAGDLGVTFSSLAVKDIMLPANLKKALSGILEAQKDAQRQLEKARGEQAVLRSLANSSGLYENNPMLLQARVIQALSAGNNTIMFGTDDRLVVKERPKSP